MAKSKNTNRNKRKYSDKRKATTEANRSLKKIQHDLRVATMLERTRSLVGKSVYFRTGDFARKGVGTVTDIVVKSDEDYPTDAKRHYGSYLKIRDSSGRIHLKSRHRVKPVGND